MKHIDFDFANDNSLSAPKIIFFKRLFIYIMLGIWAGKEAGIADINTSFCTGCMFLWGNELRETPCFWCS